MWREHNRRTFEDVVKSENQLVECFALSLFDWSRAWGFTSSTIVMLFISTLSLISTTPPSVII